MAYFDNPNDYEDPDDGEGWKHDNTGNKLNMKRLIDITDEDVIAVIDRIHLLTENKVISRNGLHGLTFEDSFRKIMSKYL